MCVSGPRRNAPSTIVAEADRYFGGKAVGQRIPIPEVCFDMPVAGQTMRRVLADESLVLRETLSRCVLGLALGAIAFFGAARLTAAKTDPAISLRAV